MTPIGAHAEFRADPIEIGTDDSSFGLALAAGRLVATVRSKKTGAHVTVQAKAKRKISNRYQPCRLDEAERIYLDTPNPEGASGTPIGVVHLDGRWAGNVLPPFGEAFDESRLWAARRVLFVAAGKEAAEDDLCEILQGKRCLVCGQELTDPESIERGIGPQCFEAATTSRHAAIGADLSVGKDAVQPALGVYEGLEEQLAAELSAGKRGAGSGVEVEGDVLPTQTASSPVPASASDPAPLFLLEAGASAAERLRSLNPGSANKEDQ